MGGREGAFGEKTFREYQNSRNAGNAPGKRDGYCFAGGRCRGKKTKAIDEQKKRLYDRRENRGLIGEIANEINESFYAGESPYEEKEEDSDISRPREEEEVNEADDSAAASDEPEAQDEERKVSEDERGERSAESSKPGNSEAAGDLVNQNEESLKKKESENESGKNE